MKIMNKQKITLDKIVIMRRARRVHTFIKSNSDIIDFSHQKEISKHSLKIIENRNKTVKWNKDIAISTNVALSLVAHNTQFNELRNITFWDNDDCLIQGRILILNCLLKQAKRQKEIIKNNPNRMFDDNWFTR